MPPDFRKAWLWAVVAALACGCHGNKGEPTATASTLATARAVPPAADKSQLVTVVTSDWSEFQGTLRRFERVGSSDEESNWRPVGDPYEVVIGRNGYGWGRGLHGEGRPDDREGPIKREGDGRSPAGVFAIGEAYGYAPARGDLSLAYARATADLRCVDDRESEHYNQIVSTSTTDVDWSSAEHMLRDDQLYVLTIVVEHNADETKPGAGSCIFIHLWNGPDEGMTGCTAMSLEALNELARWLRPGAAALVALPRGEYEALRHAWQLPMLTGVSSPSQ